MIFVWLSRTGYLPWSSGNYITTCRIVWTYICNFQRMYMMYTCFVFKSYSFVVSMLFRTMIVPSTPWLCECTCANFVWIYIYKFYTWIGCDLPGKHLPWYIYEYVYTQTYLYIYISIYMCICAYLYIYKFMNIHIHHHCLEHVHVCIYICTHIYTLIYTHKNIYIHRFMYLRHIYIMVILHTKLSSGLSFWDFLPDKSQAQVLARCGKKKSRKSVLWLFYI